MRHLIRTPLRLAVALAVLAATPLARADRVVQWDFQGDLASTDGLRSLTAHAGPPLAAPSVDFEMLDVGGEAVTVATFARGTYFRVRGGFPPNAGGGYVNQYTIVLDVNFPDRTPSGGWAAIYNTNVSEPNANDAECYAAPGGLGGSGVFRGVIEDGRWHRLAISSDLAAGYVAYFVDGVEVNRIEGQSVDGAMAMWSAVHGANDGFSLFGDSASRGGARVAGGAIASLQFRDSALCPNQVAALGAFAPGGIPSGALPAADCTASSGGLAIKEGPYLQNVTRDAMSILWETTALSDATLLWRRPGETAWRELASGALATIHELRLDGLDAGETIEYRVRSTAGTDEVASDTAVFTTAPLERRPLRFAVWGDSQDNPAVFGALVRHMDVEDPEVLVSTGDVVGTGDIYAQWGQQLLRPLRPIADETPFFVAIGNHENDSHWFYDYMAQPGNEHWFSFDYAGSHFVIIDTNYPFAPGTEQYEWLEEDLFSEAAREADWLFTFHHHPPYSEIYEESIYARVRSHLVPLFEAAGVDVDFTGHIHDYERGIYVPPDTGRRIAYIQTSGGGGLLWDDEFGGDWEQIDTVIQYVHHYCLIDITESTLRLRAIDLDGAVIDEITLAALPRDGEPPPPPPPAGTTISQWDFTDGDLRASFGDGRLEYAGGPAGPTAIQTEFGTASALGLPEIGGESTRVMRFPRATSGSMGFRVVHGAPPNGGGAFVNEYTLVYDLYVPAASFASDAWLGLFNTNADNANDSDVFVEMASGGIGISGRYDGVIEPDRWHRLALVFALEGNRPTLSKWIDGREVGRQTLDELDGRWSLYSRFDGTPWLWLLTDDSGDASSGYVSSFLFVDAPLDAATLEALGAPTASGVLEGPCLADCDRPRFVRGDVNSDGRRDVSDAVRVLVALFVEPAARIDCLDSADADDNGAVELTDAAYLLNALFRGGRSVPPPGPTCAFDSTDDALECETFAPCER